MMHKPLQARFRMYHEEVLEDDHGMHFEAPRQGVVSL